MNTFFCSFATMYHNIFHKISSIVMALLVFLSTVSFTLEKHFCGDTLIDVAIFSHADTCGMNMNTLTKLSPEKKSCCKNEVEIIKGQDQLNKASFEDLQVQKQFFLTSLHYSYINLFKGKPSQVYPHKNYSPPHLVANIQVLNQVFII